MLCRILSKLALDRSKVDPDRPVVGRARHTFGRTLAELGPKAAGPKPNLADLPINFVFPRIGVLAKSDAQLSATCASPSFRKDYRYDDGVPEDAGHGRDDRVTRKLLAPRQVASGDPGEPRSCRKVVRQLSINFPRSLNSANIGRFGPHLWPLWTTCLAKVRPEWLNFGPHRPRSGPNRPMFCNFGRTLAKFGPERQKCGPKLPILAEFGPLLSSPGSLEVTCRGASQETFG